MMSVTNMKKLLEAGVHFGHQTSSWNPKMEKYIFMQRNGIHIIDLKQTLEAINQAYYFVRELAANGKRLLFVGTKKQSCDGVLNAAKKCGEYYIAKRWYGGTLTNMHTIRKSIKYLDEFEQMQESGEIEKYTKLEILKMERKYDKIMSILGGIRDMDSYPGALIITDTNNEEIAVKEANKLDVPIVAIVDSNSDPDNIDFPIPGNDDAMKSVNLITDLLADAVLEGKGLSSEGKDVEGAEKAEEKPETKEEAEKQEEAAAEEEKEKETKKKTEKKKAEKETKKAETDKKKKPKKKEKTEEKSKKSKEKKQDDDKFACEICGKEFSSKRGLKIHMGLVHQK